MNALDRDLRNQLESTTRKARILAEAGARKALDSLGVESAKPPEGLSPEDRRLRKQLRAHGRQLGDIRHREGPERDRQSVDRLRHEIAYEHWHRRLFARFLAENQLLIHPTYGTAPSIEEWKELAEAEGADPWALAASFAQEMLPQIFRSDDPALRVSLPPEERLGLQQLLASLPREVFTADDALGWTYQFWQAAEKEAVNQRMKSGEKISGETLPAVTQLFTEAYMVAFLLENTLGAWHAGKILRHDSGLGVEATCEDQLREAVRLRTGHGYAFEYLRFVREADQEDGSGETREASPGRWRPAAGVFEGWPRTAAELRVLDPCCGSGHFLVAALPLLVALRQNEEGLELRDAVRKVLAENLFGLELDLRCTQIAAFNMAFTAWRMVGEPFELPALHVACSGLGPRASAEEWLAMAERATEAWAAVDESRRESIRNGLLALHRTFSMAPELGSLIDPMEGHGGGDYAASLYTASYEQLRPFLEAAYQTEGRDDEGRERAVVAKGMVEAAEILVGERGPGRPPYSLILTNVPYLGRWSHAEALRTWVDNRYRDAKGDLATVFLERLLKWIASAEQSGTVAAVCPQKWLFLTSYRRLRERLLRERTLNVLVRLGPGAFETISGEVVNVALHAISGQLPGDQTRFSGLDATSQAHASEKADLLRGKTTTERKEQVELTRDRPYDSSDEQDDVTSQTTGVTSSVAPDAGVSLLRQADQLKNADACVTLDVADHGAKRLEEYVVCKLGLGTGDGPHYLRGFWELEAAEPGGWGRLQTTSDRTTEWGGYAGLVAWDVKAQRVRGMADAERKQVHNQDYSGREVWGRRGLAVSLMSGLNVCRFEGDLFDKGVAVIVPRRELDLPAVSCYLESAEFPKEVRRIDKSLKVTNGSLPKIPFDLARWQKIAAETYPDGLPEPRSDDLTQWLFHGHPAFAEPKAVLQVAVARLLGYRWPAERDPGMRLAREARARVDRCEALLLHADADGIVALPAMRGERAAADRLRELLVAAFGGEPGGWSAARERDLLQAAATVTTRGKPAASLEDWLRDWFFEEHCALFHKRPFVWHVWDGRADGFHVLLNYHRLVGPDGEGRRTLRKLLDTYLGEWVERQRQDLAANVQGAEGRLAAALTLRRSLEAISEGEPPCDLFVRWKPLHEQPLGWDPDQGDWVRLNLRPFVLAGDVKTRGAGVLRVKVDDTWTNKKKIGVSDRGKEPESLRPRDDFPWFHGCNPERHPEHRTDFGAQVAGAAPAVAFDGVRWNGLHYTRGARRAARDRKKARND